MCALYEDPKSRICGTGKESPTASLTMGYREASLSDYPVGTGEFIYKLMRWCIDKLSRTCKLNTPNNDIKALKEALT